MSRNYCTIHEFIEQVDLTYKGLGLPTLYGVLSILANKSVFFIAGAGQGKTRVIKTIPELPDTFVSNWDSFTLEGLSINVGTVKDTHLVWKVEEFGTLSKYHRRIFLDIVPKIISDGQYYHITKRLWIEIVNCKLDLLIAIQPLLYSELCRTESRWESMAVDRFSKFVLLNPLREDTKDIQINPKLPIITQNAALGNVDLSRVELLFSDQISKGRKFLYARDYVTALTRFIGETKVTQKHADLFYKMFYPYLQTFNWLQYSKDLEASVEIQAGQMKLFTEIGSYNDGVTKRTLADNFKVSERNVEKYAQGLLEKGLIRKDTGQGRGKQTKYYLSEELEGFFKQYPDV